MRDHRSRTFLLSLLVLVAMACGVLPVGTAAPEGGYRYDDLPAAEREDLALADFRAISRWERLELSYFFLNGSRALPGDTEHELVRSALALWSSESPLTFAEAASADSADILIGWASGEHGDGDPFDGPGDVLAHASSPNPYQDRQLILHFDEAERWVDSETQNIDLLTVAAHELGHNLGLGHSRDPSALMYAAYVGPHRFLGQDDIAGIQELYGIAREPAPGPEVPGAGETAPPSSNADRDGDGISDDDETLRTGTDPGRADTDSDGVDDGVEVVNRMNPLDPDMDRDGVPDGAEIAAGTDPFFPETGAEVPPELEEEISDFLTAAIERQIQAYEEGNASVAADIFAGEMYAVLEADIAELNARGLVQLSSIDYYESFIADIRVLGSSLVIVDTCEVWSSATFDVATGDLVSTAGPSLLPQTVTIEESSQGWFITQVEFFDAPAFCR